MTTETQQATDLYGRLKPEAIHAARMFLLSRTPPNLQEEMIAAYEADLAQAPTGIPVVVDAPFISQTGSTMSCTLGNWTNAPTSRTYQWKKDGTNVVGATNATYTVLAADVGHVFTCSMVAHNSFGDSAPVLSNAIMAV
jgi:hypothetical protein